MNITREEKVNAIESFCMEHDCNECPLGEVQGACYGDEADIDKNYDVITGKENPSSNLVELNTRPHLSKPEVNHTTEGEGNDTHEPVNHPSHYTHSGMEAIDEMILLFGEQVVKHFCLCNAWKYRKRAMYKNGQEDMDKSDWYINKFKELSTNEEDRNRTWNF